MTNSLSSFFFTGLFGSTTCNAGVYIDCAHCKGKSGLLICILTCLVQELQALQSLHFGKQNVLNLKVAV